MECTLRDGSYAINFQFTADDTRVISKALVDVGFTLIELGHGMGLGASEKGLGVAAETDETYLRVAAETLSDVQWGMFCIPGIAELRHVDMAADYGMKFIRVGTNIEEYRKAKPFIDRAKKHGMFICSNFMKSYVSSPDEFVEYALEAEKYGADLVYIVDSAGGMLPTDVEKYVSVIRDNSATLRIGFHGHDNLGLGIANSLMAIKMGAEIVDTSLQGFGRSAGNASTEQLLSALMRSGMDMDIDPVAVMDVGERHILPLIQSRGLASVDVVSGLALFHSSYMSVIKKFATKYRVDPRRLIIAVCRWDQVNAPEDLVEEQARQLAERGVHGAWKPLYEHYYGGEQG